jgi:hypothetical protein
MNSKRNIIIVTAIALMALLAATSWSVLAANSNSYEASDMGSPSQGIPLGGAWIATLAEVNIITEWTITPLNPERTEFISVLRQVKPNPTLGGTVEADRETDWIGQIVQTGWNTFESTVVSYGTKTVEDQPQPQIVYIRVMYGRGRLVDLNTIEAEGTTAIFLPNQDADSDGFPDENQIPIWCGPYTLTSCKRVQVMPPCELPLSTEGQ